MFGASFLIYGLAIVAGLVFVYSQQKYTFPGYGGRGGLVLPIVAATVALIGLWLLGKFVGGTGNIFHATSTALSFATKYDDGTLNTAGWFLVVGLLSIAGVAVYNLVRYGKATM